MNASAILIGGPFHGKVVFADPQWHSIVVPMLYVEDYNQSPDKMPLTRIPTARYRNTGKVIMGGDHLKFVYEPE